MTAGLELCQLSDSPWGGKGVVPSLALAKAKAMVLGAPSPAKVFMTKQWQIWHSKDTGLWILMAMGRGPAAE